MTCSRRSLELKPSATLQAAAKASELKASGVNVLSMTLGEPDFPTPKHIQKAAIEAIESGKASFYTAATGLPALKTAIQARTLEDINVSYQTSEIMVGTGAKFVLYCAFQALINPDDEVILPVPFWVSYAAQVELAEGKPVYIETTDTERFKVTVEQLEAARTSKTKAIVLNTPSNPTGSIYTRDELLKIGEWAVSHNIYVIADDIYSKLVYNGNVFTSIASLSEEIKNNTVVINGVSKSYAMTGWRIGYALANKEIITQMGKIASQAISNPATVSQYAAIEALSGSQEPVEEMRLLFEKRLNTIYPLVAALPGVQVDKPQGAFYLYPDVSQAVSMCGYDTVSEWVEDLLVEEHVAIVSGTAFGTNKHVRISYATDIETLKAAVKKIENFIERKKKINSGVF